MDGKDVTEFIKGRYSPIERNMVIRADANLETLKHELGHLLAHLDRPDLYEEYLRTKDIDVRAKIERLADEYAKTMRDSIKLLLD